MCSWYGKIPVSCNETLKHYSTFSNLCTICLNCGRRLVGSSQGGLVAVGGRPISVTGGSASLVSVDSERDRDVLPAVEEAVLESPRIPPPP